VRLGSVFIAFTVLVPSFTATVGAAGANRCVAASPGQICSSRRCFIIFGLAMYKVFELRLPHSAQNCGRGRQRQGWISQRSLSMGPDICSCRHSPAFFVYRFDSYLLPRLLPPARIGVQNHRFTVLTFSGGALRAVLPAHLPGWLAKLPRSGAWLTTSGNNGVSGKSPPPSSSSQCRSGLAVAYRTQPVMLALVLSRRLLRVGTEFLTLDLTR